MATILSYEVYTLRNGHWYIDSVFDDRDQALHEARYLLDKRNQRGVRVMQETYDEDAGTSVSRILFSEERGVEKPKPWVQPPRLPRRRPATSKKKNGDSDFIRYVVILVLSVGGILLAAIGLLTILMTTFGNG